MKTLTQERLKELLHYDPETGIFKWLVRVPRSHIVVGDVAGSICARGYHSIMIYGKQYRSSRLAWLYMTGTFPVNSIDHRNRCKTDDRFANLREATSSANAQNANISARNKTGFSGVSWNKNCNKWQAYIMSAGKHRYLGVFNDISVAGAAYADAKKRLHPFYHHNGETS